MPRHYIAVGSGLPDEEGEPLSGSSAQRGRSLLACRCTPRAALLGLPLVAAGLLGLGALAGAPAGAAGARWSWVGQPEGKFSLLPTPHFDAFELCLKAYRKLFGASDPFLFQCPLPLAIRGLVPQEGMSSTLSCCRAYDTLGWPYQFPQCAQAMNCSSCLKSTGKGIFSQRAEAIELAGAAWAAVVTTKGHAKSKMGWLAAKINRKVTGLMAHATGAEQVDGHRMVASLGSGLHKHDVDLCPKVSDWSMHMLTETDQNIHARIFRSASAKLAIVAFRGTQATSMKNWQVDANIKTVGLPLDRSIGGSSTQVHAGFVSALEDVLPTVRRWVEGYVLHFGAVPDDWTLVFTGHSLGGALALLASTLAEVRGWKRRPDFTITWGAPRIADRGLNDWWESRGMCRKLLRVNAYNDIIHWFPFKKMWNWWTVLTDITDIMGSTGEHEKSVAFADSSRWTHVCDNSEFIVPSSMKGLNEHLQDFSTVGAILSHFVSNCLFGYGYGVMNSGIASHDVHCGVGPSMCPGLA